MPTIRSRIARLAAASAVVVSLGALVAGPAAANSASGSTHMPPPTPGSFENGWVSKDTHPSDSLTLKRGVDPDSFDTSKIPGNLETVDPPMPNGSVAIK